MGSTWGDEEVDPLAYEKAIKTFNEGDIAIIFTPDDTHYNIASACIEHGMHVLITKPIVQTLKDHISLLEESKKKGVLVGVEVHKRLDPFYADARDRIRSVLGDF